MSDETEDRNPVEALAEEFLERYRCGERPPLTEFVSRHPELADEIRELFPALAMMEEAVSSPHAAPAAGAAPRGNDGQALRRLGDFLILREVGRGGMGIVYEAEQESLGRRVALKVLPFGSASEPMRLARFRREARSAARLHHSNIVPVHEVGEHQGVHYYAMQFIRGQGLDQVLKEVRRCRAGETAAPDDALSAGLAGNLLTGRFVLGEPAAAPDPSAPGDPTVKLRAGSAPAPPRPRHVHAITGSANSATSEFASAAAAPYYRSVARLGAQAADALAYAHEQKVLHRDVKPANLILDVHGQIWVTDFGLAKAEGEDLTRTGDLVGTLRYMAPERFSGRADPRSDVYSLGLTLYEMLTLAPAFDESDRGLLIRRVVNEEPPRPRRLDPTVPRDLETVVLKAIAREPGRRYQSAGELAEDLRRFLNDQPIRARHVTAAERLWRWVRREPRLAAAVGLVVGLALAVVIGQWLAYEKLAAESKLRGQESERRGQAETQALAAKADADLALGQSLLEQGAANQSGGLAGQRFHSLDLLRQAAQVLRAHPQGGEYLPRLRDEMTAALALTDVRPLWERDIRPGMCVSCDGRLELYANDEPPGGDIVIRRMEDNAEVSRLLRARADYLFMAHGFSPDGRYLWATYLIRDSADTLLHVWDVNRKERLLEKKSGCVSAFFHPDGKRLVYCPKATLPTLSVRDLETGREQQRLLLGMWTPLRAQMALSPDGSLVASTRTWIGLAGGDNVTVFEVETGRKRQSWADPRATQELSWGAGGRLLAIGGELGPASVWESGQETRLCLLQGHTKASVACRFAPRGTLLSTSGWDDTMRLWDGASGEPLVTAPGRSLGFSPAGDRLAFLVGTRLGVWEVAHGRECRTLHPDFQGNDAARLGLFSGTHGADFSPDGRLLAVAHGEGVRLFDAALGSDLGLLAGLGCESARFHPEARALVTYGALGHIQVWPLHRTDREGGSTWHVGPPQLVCERGSDEWLRLCWLPGEANTLAVVDNNHRRVSLLRVDMSGGPPESVGELPSQHGRMTGIAVSPDGRWAAAGGWKEGVIQVWDVATRKLARLLPPNDGKSVGHVQVTFSPDGRWLAAVCQDTEGGRFTFWRTDTWEPGLPPVEQEGRAAGWAPPTYTPDGKLMALALSPRRVRIAEAATGKTVAHLTTRQPLAPAPLTFSPDGARLAAVTNQRDVLLWDLRRIRAALAREDLDWSADPLPPEKDEATRPLTVVIEK
jgi:serine/threonine protein kinase/WD40 repeat protein